MGTPPSYPTTGSNLLIYKYGKLKSKEKIIILASLRYR
jgi:hypothetical protein